MNNTPKIEPDSLAEQLYNYYSLNDLQQLLDRASFDQLRRKWKLSDAECIKQIEMAMHYIKQD